MLVEFVLVLPLLLFIVFGIVQFGFAMNAKIDATHLTAEGARYIAVNQNPGLTDASISPKTMQNFVLSRGDTQKFRDDARVCISYPTNPVTGTSAKVGDPVKVALDDLVFLSSDFSVGPLPWFGTTLTIPGLTVGGETTMRLEAEPTNIPAGCTS